MLLTSYARVTGLAAFRIARTPASENSATCSAVAAIVGSLARPQPGTTALLNGSAGSGPAPRAKSAGVAPLGARRDAESA